jgi:hypothetical protein
MIRSIVCSLAIASTLAITSCTSSTDNKEGKTDASTPAQSTAASTAATPSPAASPEIVALSKTVAAAETAVEGGDFKKAKTEMAKFKGLWSKTEDIYKKKAPKAYGKIETNEVAALAAIKASNKAKALAALKIMSTEITSVK